MPRILLGLALVLAVVGCNSSPAAAHKSAPSVTAQSVALQPRDVSGLLRCDASGGVDTVLNEEKSSDPVAYRQDAPEWTRWRSYGATEAYFAIYGRTPADCAAVSGLSAGAPTGGLMAGLVVKFKDEPTAAKIYQGSSTLLGFGPKDLTFLKLAGGDLTAGPQIGLGPQSEAGSASIAGATYFMAFWHRSMFDSYFISYDVDSRVAESAVMSVNERMSGAK